MRTLLLIAALSLTGCASHELVVTNTTDKDATLSQTIPGGEHSIKLRPGASVSFPASTPLILEGLRVDYH